LIDTIRLRVHGANQHKQGVFAKVIAENSKTSMHLVPEHNALFMKLHNCKKEGFSSTQILSQEKMISNNDDIEDVVTNETSKQKNHFFTSNKIRFQSAEYVKERTANTYGKYNIRSSETEVTYILNYEGGYMDFEFSIPKYLFGHNLAQFIPQVNSSTYYKYSSSITSWAKQKDLLFNRFNKFVNLFLQDLFFSLKLEYMPNMNYVELVRIDFCYNQYFENDELCLLYLEEQKKLRKKSKVFSPDMNTDYKTTIAWRTQNGNYFKIYHKGSEYVNQKFGDFKKHNDINKIFLDTYFKEKIAKTNVSLSSAFYLTENQKENDKYMLANYKRYQDKIKNLLKKSVTGESFHISDEELSQMKKVLIKSEEIQPINTHFFKKEMDKILRYEVSVSGKYASYQFKNYIFRKNCPIHQEAKKIYKKVKSQLESPDRFEHKIPSYHMTLYKTFHKWFNKSNCFVLSKNSLLADHSRRAGFDFDKLSNVYKISDAYKELGYGTILDKSSTSNFSKSYLNHLIDNFRKTILDFQVTELEPFDDLQKRVIRFNENVDENKEKFNSKSIYNMILLNPKFKKRFEKLSIKKNPDYLKCTELLTESEKQKRGLQKISYSDCLEVFTLMEDKSMSLNEIQEHLNLSKGQFYRRRNNLKMLGISESSIKMKVPIKPKLDFYTYYFKTGSKKYQKDFFLKPIHCSFS
jgi:hypothetical protein